MIWDEYAWRPNERTSQKKEVKQQRKETTLWSAITPSYESVPLCHDNPSPSQSPLCHPLLFSSSFLFSLFLLWLYLTSSLASPRFRPCVSPRACDPCHCMLTFLYSVCVPPVVPVSAPVPAHVRTDDLRASTPEELSGAMARMGFERPDITAAVLAIRQEDFSAQRATEKARIPIACRALVTSVVSVCLGYACLPLLDPSRHALCLFSLALSQSVMTFS